MPELNVAELDLNHFDGQASLTEGTAKDGSENHLAKILQDVRSDLQGSNISVTESYAGQVLIFDIAGGATLDTDLAIPAGVKIQVLDAWVVNKGAGTVSDTVQIKNSATAISDAIDISGADLTIARASTLDDAQWELDGDSSDILRVTLTDGGGSDVPAVRVFVAIAKVV